MSTSTSMPVQCPACGHRFTAQIVQIVDVGAEPRLKERVLNGQLNVVTCPQCGSSGAMSGPLLYHDPEHDLLLSYLPMELNLPQDQRERLVGDLLRRLMDSIPPQDRRGYLFNPQAVLTMDGLFQRILEAEGVPPEVLERQRKQGRLLSRLLAASDAEVEALAREHDEELDEEFFQLLTSIVDRARRAGQDDEAQRIRALRNRLLGIASWSREAGLTPKMLDEQESRLQLLERFLEAKEDEWAELAQANDGELDYLFFQLLTALIEGTDGEMEARLTRLRQQLADLTTAGKEVRASEEAVRELRQAADKAGGLNRELLLEQILQADGETAVETLAVAGAPLIDYSFFLLMADRIDAAEKRGDREEATRLSSLREKLVSLTDEWEQQRGAEIERANRRIDELLASEDMDVAVKQAVPDMSELLLSLLASRAQNARQAGQEASAARLEDLLSRILTEIRAAAPPEVKLINEMLDLENEAAMREALEKRRDEITPVVLGLLKEMLADVRRTGRKTVADQLQTLYDLATEVTAG
jgi:hypothetical protein